VGGIGTTADIPPGITWRRAETAYADLGGPGKARGTGFGGSMEIVLVLVISFGMGLAISNIAKEKGYDSFPWFVYGFLIWPVALLHVWVLKSRTDEVVATAMASVEQRHHEFPGALLGHDGGGEQRALLTLEGFSWILTTDAGDRWEEGLQGVRLLLRGDGLLEVTLGANNWLFRPDDEPRLAREGASLGIEFSPPPPPSP
jgi:hypothetical protein